jgi:hypothetical protein
MYGKWTTPNSTVLNFFRFKFAAVSSMENITAGSTKIRHVEDNSCETLLNGNGWSFMTDMTGLTTVQPEIEHTKFLFSNDMP